MYIIARKRSSIMYFPCAVMTFVGHPFSSVTCTLFINMYERTFSGKDPYFVDMQLPE